MRRKNGRLTAYGGPTGRWKAKLGKRSKYGQEIVWESGPLAGRQAMVPPETLSATPGGQKK